MSMPILASAVERRPHLFVDVRESSSVHLACTRLPAFGPSSTTSSRKQFDPKSFVWSTNSERARASVNRARQCQPREGQVRVDPLD
jgi:hypothetical protein